MHEVIRIKSKVIFPLIEEILNEGGSVRISITGMSMYPFLRNSKDSVELSAANFENIKRGDIVAILRDNNEYIIHRVFKKKNECFYLVGDAQQWIEGPINKNQLIAIVTAIWRGQKKISCSNLWWKILSTFWLIILPFRYPIINTYMFLIRIFRNFYGTERR